MDQTKRVSVINVKENRVLHLLFSAWILSLPFFRLDIVGTLSLDNILAPIVLVVWLFHKAVSGYPRLGRERVIYIIAACLYLLLSLSGFIASGNLDYMLTMLSSHGKVVLYLLLPVLCIQSIDKINGISRLLVIVTVIVSLSAVADSTGIVRLQNFIDMPDRSGDVGRFGHVSIGGVALGSLSRSAGLVVDFGPLAALIAFSLVTLLSIEKTERNSSLGAFLSSAPVRIAIFVTLLLGAIVAQSRNVVLTSLIAVGGFTAFKMLSSNNKGLTILFGVTILFFLAIMTVLMALSYEDVYHYVVGAGAMRASALARVAQYEWAWKMMSENPIFGLSGLDQERYRAEIGFVHNLWINTVLRGGVIGLLPILLLFYKSIFHTLKLRISSLLRRKAVSMAALAIAFAASSLFYVAQSSLIYWALFGIVLSFQSVGAAYLRLNSTAARKK